MTYFAGEYDIAVIGAGHAGCEAALAGARLGCRTVVFSMNLDSIANMPCNPSIGGTAKGHLVREIDALGGEMGKNTDKTFIQSKILNSAKGPAVFSLRAQADRRQYQMEMKHTLEKQEGLDIKQAEVVELLSEEGRIKGVMTHTGAIYHCRAVILTTGTYLKGRIIIGDVSYSGGPDGLFPAGRLSDSLIAHGIELLRFKTGTPARLSRRSVDFSKLEEQPGDPRVIPFSFETEEIQKDQVSCWLTYTTEETHRVIKDNLHRSPLYSGDIKGVGPRYCPSIEDKVVRFADKDKHQVFLEPMGLGTEEMYLQGMSSSLPEDVQIKMMKTIPGLENVSVMRSAYAIEYDCIDATNLNLNLEFKKLPGLFSAGQINGSSGYEEAAAQGLMAGINAAMSVKGGEPFILDRSQAYIGVLIDDLVTKGTREPYRMMTSRSEYRLLLRQDNADLRLTPMGYKVGLISRERFTKFEEKRDRIGAEIERLEKTVVPPSEAVNSYLESMGSTPVKSGVKLVELLRRPEITYASLAAIDKGDACSTCQGDGGAVMSPATCQGDGGAVMTQTPEDQDHRLFEKSSVQSSVSLPMKARPLLSRSVMEQVEISVKYEGYIKRQQQQVEQFKKLEKRKLPPDLDYGAIHGLRLEARQKLGSIRPDSIGQASRITGVSPADISVLLVYLEQRRG